MRERTTGQRFLDHQRAQFLQRARTERTWDDWQARQMSAAYRAAARSLRQPRP